MNDDEIQSWLDKLLNLFVGVLLGLMFGLGAVKECKAEVDILLGQWSYHYNRNYSFNESHNLVGIDTGNYIIARFKNSYNRTSFTAMKAMDLSGGWRWAFGISTGYQDVYGSKVVPVVLLNKRYGYVDFNFIPSVGLTVGFRF